MTLTDDVQTRAAWPHAFGARFVASAGRQLRLALEIRNTGASPFTVEDPDWSRRIVVAKSGSRSTVVWNPWIEKARSIGDLGEAAWTGMVCVETANAAEDARTLAPGALHVLEAVIAVEQD